MSGAEKLRLLGRHARQGYQVHQARLEARLRDSGAGAGQQIVDEAAQLLGLLQNGGECLRRWCASASRMSWAYPLIAVNGLRSS